MLSSLYYRVYTSVGRVDRYKYVVNSTVSAISIEYGIDQLNLLTDDTEISKSAALLSAARHSPASISEAVLRHNSHSCHLPHLHRHRHEDDSS